MIEKQGKQQNEKEGNLFKTFQHRPSAEACVVKPGSDPSSSEFGSVALKEKCAIETDWFNTFRVD